MSERITLQRLPARRHARRAHRRHRRVSEARKPSYRLEIDFGRLGRRQSSAAVRTSYRKEDLLGRLVVCVVNFAPRRIAGFDSEVLVLGAMEASGRIVLLRTDDAAELGSPIG